MIINTENEVEFAERMKAARDRASYELGDPSWAGVIVGAFLHPDEDAAALAALTGDQP